MFFFFNTILDVCIGAHVVCHAEPYIYTDVECINSVYQLTI